jgi:hypothetical protein
VLLTDAGPVPGRGEEQLDDITVAVKAECTACGHWMLFDSLKFRTGQERIMLLHSWQTRKNNAALKNDTPQSPSDRFG